MQKHLDDYKYSTVEESVTAAVYPARARGKLMSTWRSFLSGAGRADFAAIGQCNICKSRHIRKFFSVWDFDYYRCSDCCSIFLNPRPSREFYDKVFYDSPISKLISSAGYQRSLKARFDRFVLPLIEPAFYFPDDAGLTVLEVCGRDKNILEFLTEKRFVKRIYRYRPYARVSGGKITESASFADIPDRSCDIVLGALSFESLLMPADVFGKMSSKVKPGGQMVILSRAGNGFDVQVLKGHSENIFPLEHMNLISIEGYETLCKKNSLVVRELSTPGLLDAMYVKRRIDKTEDMEFFKYLFGARSDEVIGRFQNFLQYARLSSAVRLVCYPK